MRAINIHYRKAKGFVTTALLILSVPILTVSVPLFIGKPSFDNKYVFIENNKPEIMVFEDDRMTIKIEIPSSGMYYSDRFTINATFNNKVKTLIPQEYDIKIVPFSSKKALTPYLTSYSRNPLRYSSDMTFLHDIDELETFLKYRHSHYDFTSNFDLENISNKFPLKYFKTKNIKLIVKITMFDYDSNKEVVINKTLSIKNNRRLTLRKFRIC